jgi:hypothetical protein
MSEAPNSPSLSWPAARTLPVKIFDLVFVAAELCISAQSSAMSYLEEFVAMTAHSNAGIAGQLYPKLIP